MFLKFRPLEQGAERKSIIPKLFTIKQITTHCYEGSIPLKFSELQIGFDCQQKRQQRC